MTSRPANCRLSYIIIEDGGLYRASFFYVSRDLDAETFDAGLPLTPARRHKIEAWRDATTIWQARR